MPLLTFGSGQSKMKKGLDFGWYIGILHLAPYNLSGRNVCPWASRGCAEACLHTAGRGIMSSVQEARLKKTNRFFEDREAFIAELDKDIGNAKKRAKNWGMKLAIRLNGTSDIPWHLIATDMMLEHSDVQFYDYTKDAKRVFMNHLENYDITFSASEDNQAAVDLVLNKGGRVAFVYRGNMPALYRGFKVYDGDAHDMRFLDPSNCAVALKEKGKAKKDTTGFVMNS